MRASFWFLPAVIVVAAVGMAAAVIGVDATVELKFVDRWPLQTLDPAKKNPLQDGLATRTR